MASVWGFKGPAGRLGWAHPGLRGGPPPSSVHGLAARNRHWGQMGQSKRSPSGETTQGHSQEGGSHTRPTCGGITAESPVSASLTTAMWQLKSVPIFDASHITLRKSDF